MAEGSSGRNPSVLAIVICDAIYQDAGTRKYTLLGTFSSIRLRQFPYAVPLLAAFVSLTDGYGEIELRVRLIRVDNDQFNDTEVAESPSYTVNFDDPLMVVDLPFALQNVVFSERGEHRFQVVAGNGAVLRERKFLVGDLPSN